MEKQNIKIISVVIVAIVITFLVCYAVFVYFPNQQKTKDLNEYKKAIFESSLCQYKCPLTPQEIANVTQNIPNITCVQECVSIFKNKTLAGESYSDEDLKNDDLFIDFQQKITDCRKSAIENSTRINTSLFFECVPAKLEELRAEYIYLN